MAGAFDFLRRLLGWHSVPTDEHETINRVEFSGILTTRLEACGTVVTRREFTGDICRRAVFA